MLSIGLTKLQLDDAVGGQESTLDGEGSKEDRTAKEMRKSLLTTLRSRFEAGKEGATLPGLEGVKEEKENGAEAHDIKPVNGGDGAGGEGEEADGEAGADGGKGKAKGKKAKVTVKKARGGPALKEETKVEAVEA